MRFAALGRTAMLLASARACVAAGHELVAVATAAASPESAVREVDFEALAAEHRAAFTLGAPPPRSGAEVAISVNWPALLDRRARDAYPHGILNGHAGDLPRFRGNAAPNWAILLGERRVVATVHRMDDGLDSGPILAQRAIPLGPDTYVGDVYAELERAFPALFAQVLDALAAGTARPRPQPADPALALRCHPRRREDSEIDWAAPAADVARLVRASAEPFSGAYTWLDGERVTVWRARASALETPAVGIPGQVIALRGGEIDVLAGDGRVILERVDGPLVRSLRARLGRPPWPRPTGTPGTSARTR